MSNRGWRAGDFWRVCDVCGFDYRASQTIKRWDGLFVCLADWETRHPQDFVRGRMDHQRVPDPRPVPADVFISTALDYVLTPNGDYVITQGGDEVQI